MSSAPDFQIANPEFLRLLKDLPRELNVLDVACGSGIHGAELIGLYGHRVAGVDLSARPSRKPKRAWPKRTSPISPVRNAIPKFCAPKFRHHCVLRYP